MVPTLILDQCKRVKTIYFGIIEREYTNSNYGKNQTEEALETTKSSVSSGKCSH